jgi:hypothetical protein
MLASGKAAEDFGQLRPVGRVPVSNSSLLSLILPVSGLPVIRPVSMPSAEITFESYMQFFDRTVSQGRQPRRVLLRLFQIVTII